MHEMALAEEVLQIVQAAAQREGFRRVHTLWLEIGQLSCVEPDAMRFCFEAVARDSIADAARLEIGVTQAWHGAAPAPRGWRWHNWARPARVAADTACR